MASENMRLRKALYILLALVVAAGIWLYADLFGDNGSARSAEVTITDIPITYTGESALADRGLMLLEEDSSASVDLTFTGARMLVVRLTRENIRVTASLSDVDSAGIQSVRYDVTFSDRRFSTSMITERSISTATVSISELNSKTVDIVCELVGNMADNCSAGQVQLSQNTLEIRGQAENIDPVSYAKVTLDIGENAMQSVTQTLSFQYYDEADQLLDSTGIHPTVQTVQATLPVYVTKVLTLAVDFQESDGARISNLDYEIRPATITVSGDAGVLRNIDTITLGQLDLLDLRSSGASVHTYSIIVPDGCENLSGVTRATLDIRFRDMTSAQVKTDRFQYTNLASGKTVEFLNSQLSVTIFGTEADVSAVTGDAITVTADLSNYTGASGTYTVPASIQVDTQGDVGISGTYLVQVTIRDEADTDSDQETDAPEPDSVEE